MSFKSIEAAYMTIVTLPNTIIDKDGNTTRDSYVIQMWNDNTNKTDPGQQLISYEVDGTICAFDLTKIITELTRKEAEWILRKSEIKPYLKDLSSEQMKSLKVVE